MFLSSSGEPFQRPNSPESVFFCSILGGARKKPSTGAPPPNFPRPCVFCRYWPLPIWPQLWLPQIAWQHPGRSSSLASRCACVFCQVQLRLHTRQLGLKLATGENENRLSRDNPSDWAPYKSAPEVPGTSTKMFAALAGCM